MNDGKTRGNEGSRFVSCAPLRSASEPDFVEAPAKSPLRGYKSGRAFCMKTLARGGAGLLLLAVTTFAEPAETRLFEMRTYFANPDKLEALHARFRDHTTKLFAQHGITNIGYWVPIENPENKLIYVLAYPDRAAREVAWKEFSADREWKSVQKESEEGGKLVAKVEQLFMNPTDYSP